MNWNDIQLNDAYERGLNILDSYNFETLLLEISCNVRDINKATIIKQFEETLQSKIECAKETFEANLNNILKKAIEERERP